MAEYTGEQQLRWLPKKGGKAVIIRSLSSATDDAPHTGAMKYEDGTEKIPAVAIGPKGADNLAKLLNLKKLQPNSIQTAE